MRVRGIAEQLGPPRPQLEDVGDDPVVVVRVAVVAARGEHAPDLLAQLAARRPGEEGIDARARVDDGPLPRLAAAGGGGRGRLAQRGGQAGQVGLSLEQDQLRALLGEHVLAEVGEERGEALVQFGELFLGRLVQLCAGADELGVVEPHQPLLLGIEIEAVALLVHRGDALEELLVLHDPIVERGQLGSHLALDGLDLVVVHRRCVDGVDAADAVEGVASPFHGGDGVVERRRGGVGDDAVDLRQVLGHGCFQRRLEIRDLEAAEGRNAAPGTDPRLEERVGRRGGLRGRGFRRIGCAADDDDDPSEDSSSWAGKWCHGVLLIQFTAERRPLRQALEMETLRPDSDEAPPGVVFDKYR